METNSSLITPFPEVIWLLIDSVRGLFLRHDQLLSPVEVVVAVADQKPDDDDDLKKMLLLHSWESLFQTEADPFCLEKEW